jgi:hypothetical protein
MLVIMFFIVITHMCIPEIGYLMLEWFVDVVITFLTVCVLDMISSPPPPLSAPSLLAN